MEGIRRKYQIHDEVESYLSTREEEANERSRQRTAGTIPQAFAVRAFCTLAIVDARMASFLTAEKYAGEVDFSGGTEEMAVSTAEAGTIPITVYKPSNVEAATDPAIFVYFHGWGNCVGARQSVDVICKIFATGANCIVVNSSYRLAPEHPFPASNNDAKAVLSWVIKNKQLLGGSANSRVGVGGDSAGSRLAAVVCHEVPEVDFQVLVYPDTDVRGESPSHKEFEAGPLLAKEFITWFRGHYIEEPADYDNVRASPILYSDFSNLPPALVIAAEIDPLRDDAYAYNDKMEAAGVPTRLVTIKGACHAFFHLPGHFQVLCKEAHGAVIDFIKEHS